MRPNVVILGFKNDWLTTAEAAVDYFNIIHDALDLKYGVGLLRLQSGLDFSDFFGPGKTKILLYILINNFSFQNRFTR